MAKSIVGNPNGRAARGAVRTYACSGGGEAPGAGERLSPSYYALATSKDLHMTVINVFIARLATNSVRDIKCQLQAGSRGDPRCAKTAVYSAENIRARDGREGGG